jgi:hypothetical protein
VFTLGTPRFLLIPSSTTSAACSSLHHPPQLVLHPSRQPLHIASLALITSESSEKSITLSEIPQHA